MNQKWLYYLVFGAIAAAVGFFMAKMDNNAPAPAQKNAGVTPVTPSGAPSVAVPAEADVPPPWANSKSAQAEVRVDGQPRSPSGVSEQPAIAGAPRSGAAQSKSDLADINKMQTELLAIVQSGNPDTKKLAEVLHRLKQTQGANVGGVNVDVLINNLEKSQQLQDLSVEMQKEAQKAGGPDQKKMQENVERLKKIQAQMRTDVMVPNAGAATPVR